MSIFANMKMGKRLGLAFGIGSGVIFGIDSTEGKSDDI